MKFILPKTNDLRFTHLSAIAEEAGFQVLQYNENTPSEPGVFLFPFNLDEKACLDALGKIPSGSFVFFGKSTNDVKEDAGQKNIHLTYLLEKKRYLLKNAEHTAEGTLAEIITNTHRKLDELCFLIYGYGNCGRAIARLLWLCGCEVWVWSRERGQALAQSDGFNVYPAPVKGLGMFDGIINTVPDSIFSTQFLSTMRHDSSFFQIASGFSGIDTNALEQRGIRFFPLHGLPGKYCPASEADAIWYEITRTLSIKRSIL